MSHAVHMMRLLSFLLLLLIFGSDAKVHAQALTSGGYDLRLFRPAVDSKGLASVNGTDIIPHRAYSFGLTLDGAFNLLPYQGYLNDSSRSPAEAERRDFLIQQYFTGLLHFNVGLFNRLSVGAQLPIVVIRGGNVQAPGQWNENVEGGLGYEGVGNLALHAKYRILHPDRFPIGLAAIVQVGLPTGTSEQFAGEPGVSLWPALAVGIHPTRTLRINAEIGYRFISGDGATIGFNTRTDPMPLGVSATNALVTTQGDDVTYQSHATFGAGLALRVLPAVDLIAEGYANQVLGAPHGGFSPEALGGIKVFVEQNSYLLLAFACGNLCLPVDGFNQPEYRGILSFVFEPSTGDRDGDGYKDDADDCPNEPEDFDDFADDDGCPDPDNDKDGISDIEDECPLVAEDHDGDADHDGCPEGNDADRDGDGLLDNVDECPDEPEDLDGYQDEDGCPDLDNDKDGILDKVDMCPNEPEDKDKFQDKDGCPDADNDQDRILDVDDACPNKPETYNGFEDKDGCPDRGSVIIEDNQITILEKIYFETDSAEIQRRSSPIVDAVAATLIGNPQITKIEIQGHADERGDDGYNLRLTSDRAAAVLDALVHRGVDPHRMRSAGYGERCPLQEGHSEVAWEKNRRVEFKILETEGGPTGVEVACPAGRALKRK